MLKQVAYLGGYIDPAFERMIAASGSVAFGRIDHGRPLVQALPLLSCAHAVQIDSARMELPAHFLVGPDLLSHCGNLLVVSTNGAGFDPVDVTACTEAGIIVVNQAGGNREAVAEHTLGMMLSLTKRIAETDKAMRAARIANRMGFMGADLFGKTIGIVGFGQIGTRVAELCRGLFAMHILAYDPYVDEAAIAAHGAGKTGLETLLQISDFVSVHCPLTAETRGLVGAREFALMKPRAFFVSTARGGIHDEGALFEALKSGHIAGAGLDVWDAEPPASDHPLLTLPNVIASPHTAGVTHDARRRVAEMAAEQLLAIFRGERPERLINPQVWPRYRQRFAAAFGS